MALLASTGACVADSTTGGDGSGGVGSAGQGGLGGAGGLASAVRGGAGGGGTPSTLANFATMHEIVFTLCGGSGCHQPGDTPPALLDDAKLYSTLTTFVSKKCGNRVLVKPGSPEDSAFYLAQAGQCGSSLAKMPFGCVDQCTPPDYLEGIRQWILNGAPKN